MDVLHIALVVLALCGAWAVVELALVLRRARTAVGSLDRVAERLGDAIEEARPVVAKLDGAVDELQPALAQLEPLLKQANVATEALSADLVEVNGVLRDISAVSDVASSASAAVSGFAGAASEKVHKIFSKPSKDVAPALGRSARDRSDQISDAPRTEGEACDDDGDGESGLPEDRRYFTYTSIEESEHE